MTFGLPPSEPRRHSGSVANRSPGSLRRRLIMSAAGTALFATSLLGAAALTETSASATTPPAAAVSEPMSFAGIVQKVKPAVPG